VTGLLAEGMRPWRVRYCVWKVGALTDHGLAHGEADPHHVL